MSLRWQLALVCLSLLVLPWAAFLFVAELDRNLRESQVGATVARAADAAAVMAENRVAGVSKAENSNSALDGGAWRRGRVRPESKTLLAAPMPNPVLLDGYADDWSAFEMRPRQFRYAQNKIAVDEQDAMKAARFSVFSAERNGRLYLYLRVTDEQLIYHDPQSFRIASGDNVIVRVQDGKQIRRYTFSPESPGELVGQYHGSEFEGERPVRQNPNYRAVLVTTEDGYNIEMRLPLPRDGEFGVTVIDIDRINGVPRWTGMFDPREEDDTGQLKTLSKQLNRQLAVYAEPGMHLRVYDGQGWLAAEADQRLPDALIRNFSPASANIFDAVLYRFIAWVLEKKVDAAKLPDFASGKLDVNDFDLFNRLDANAQFLRDQYGRVFLSVVRRIESENDLMGYLLLQRPRVSLTAFTESAMLRLVKISGLAMIFVASILVLFATLLSWRVRRLRDSVENSVAGDGQIRGQITRSRAADEIGDLSRSYHSIIGRLGNYTDYLQSLASKLSHELRTPLSVVTTSLESIDRSKLDDQTLVSIERAESGASRLQKLIRNLSEAASLEQTITASEKAPLDLCDWLTVARDVYENIYPQRRFAMELVRVEQATVSASAELLHQMIDKLVSNAVDFSPSDSTITLGLYGHAAGIDLLVENIGSKLPHAMEHEVFEPMVSERHGRDDQPHMGLGLHIVRLIATFHGATCRASNVASRNAVQFSVGFPLSALEAD